MTNQEHPKIVVSLREPTPTAPQLKQPFVEPKLTWVEPTLTQQGALTAVAQTGGFFGSFSP